jgi:hypothetical protein
MASCFVGHLRPLIKRLPYPKGVFLGFATRRVCRAYRLPAGSVYLARLCKYDDNALHCFPVGRTWAGAPTGASGTLDFLCMTRCTTAVFFFFFFAAVFLQTLLLPVQASFDTARECLRRGLRFFSSRSGAHRMYAWHFAHSTRIRTTRQSTVIGTCRMAIPPHFSHTHLVRFRGRFSSSAGSSGHVRFE